MATPTTSGRPVSTRGTSHARRIQSPMNATSPSGRRPSVGSTRSASGRSRSRPSRSRPRCSEAYVHRKVQSGIPRTNHVCAPEDRGRPAVADERAKRECKCCRRRSQERGDDAVHFTKRLASVAFEYVQGRHAKRLQAPLDPLRSPQRDDYREAERCVVEDDKRAALLPHRGSRSSLTEEIRASV